MKLGFRLKKQLVPLGSDTTDLLLEMGKSQVEVHCLNHSEDLTLQDKKTRCLVETLLERFSGVLFARVCMWVSAPGNCYEADCPSDSPVRTHCGRALFVSSVVPV